MKKIILIILSIVICITIGGLGYGYYNIEPKIVLNGDNTKIINYGEEYKEEGAEASILKQDYTNKIKTEGNVNTNQIGEYEIKYTIKVDYLKKSNSVTRKIKVIDNVKPELSLIGKTEISMYVGDKFKEEGYKAIDKVDGDITKQVKVTNNINNNKEGKYEVIYEITDSSNNTISTKRIINIVKKPEPVKVTTTKKTTTTTTSSLVKTQTGTGKGIPILMYHYFYDETKGEKGKNSNYMEIHDFEDQIKYLVDNNYYFPSWDEVKQYVEGKITLPSKSVVITIDDGQSSFFNLAIPIINKYKVKATGFIITSKPGGTKFKKYISDNMIFQSHTHNMHRAGCTGGRGGLFRCIDFEDGVEDLKTSINILGSSDAIAYPFGDITDNTLKITKAAGFKVGVTIKYDRAKKGMDPLQLPRVRMSKGVSLSAFKNMVA